MRFLPSLRLQSIETPTSRTAGLLSWGPILLLTGLALILRVFLLGKHDYWDDEMIVTFVIRQSLWDIYRNVMVNDSHPPLYHMLLRLWTLAFGSELWMQRLFSAITGTLCVPATYLLAREITGERRASLLAALLMAIAPFQIYHSQQARMYPLLTLLVTLTIFTFIIAWRYGQWWQWALVCLCCTMGIYTHIYFWFSLLALNVWAVFDTWSNQKINWKQWRGAFISQSIAVLLFLPFVPTMFGTVQSTIASFWIKSNSIFDWLFDLISLTNYASFITDPFHPQVTVELFATFFPALLAIVLPLFYSVRRAIHYPSERPNWLLLHTTIWVPIIVATGISLTIRPILLDRSLIGLSAPLFILMAWMFSKFWQRKEAQATAFLYTASVVFMIGYLSTVPAHHNDLFDVANRIAAERQPGDAVAYIDWQMFDASALVQPTLPDVYALPSQTKATNEWLERMRVMHMPEPHYSEPVADFASRYRRVWLVFTVYTAEMDYHKEASRGWLRQHGQEVESFETAQSFTYLFEINQP